MSKYLSTTSRNRKKLKAGEVIKIVLKTVGVAGVISVAVLATNCIQMLEQLGLIKGPRARRRKKDIQQIIRRLEGRGLVVVKNNKDGKRFVSLTKKGEHELARYTLGEQKIEKQKRWDKKWRVVIFDIPEKRRKTRDLVRLHLKTMGFVLLQNSVWVHAYPCEEVVALLKSHLWVGKNLLYMFVDSIENDTRLKKHFNI